MSRSRSTKRGAVSSGKAWTTCRAVHYRIPGFFLRGQAAGRAQAAHTPADVPISAYARDDQIWRRFVGVQENTDVFFKIANVMR